MHCIGRNCLLPKRFNFKQVWHCIVFIMGTVPWGRPAWKIDPKPGSGGMVAEWLRNGCGTYGEPFCGPWHISTSKLIYSDIPKLRNEKQKRKRTTISKVTHLVCLSCYRFYSWKVYDFWWIIVVMVVWETTYGMVTPEGKSSKHFQNKRNIMKTRIAERKRSVGILSEYLRNGHFDFYLFGVKV